MTPVSSPALYWPLHAAKSGLSPATDLGLHSPGTVATMWPMTAHKPPGLRPIWVLLWRLVLCWCGIWGHVWAATGLAQEIVLKAWTIGPDDPSVYRATNLHTAAERLNAELAQAGAPERVKVDTDFWTGQAQQYVQRLLLAFQSGDIPDIVLNGHEFVGRYALGGSIRPLDDLLVTHQAALADIYP